MPLRRAVAPELTEGPYYHTEGHPIRQNMAEDQLGLPFVSTLDLLWTACTAC